MPRPTAIALIALATLVPTVGVAQSARGGARLDVLRDSLRRDSDPAALERRMAESGKPRTPMERLRNGMIAIRLGELRSDRAPLDAAIAQFEEVARRERRWPYPWFGLALAKLRLHELGHVARATPTQPLGSSYYEGFVGAVESTIERDPSFAPMWQLLDSLLPAMGEQPQPGSILRVLAGAADRGTREPNVYLVLGRAYRMGGRAEFAVRAFERYLSSGGDRGIGRLELARSFYAMGRVGEAVEAYWAGLERLSVEGRAFYRADFEWIADAEELSRFDGAPVDSLVPWALAFWTLRDAEAIREPGKRLQEHLRRWLYVHSHFRLQGPVRLRRHFQKVYARPLKCSASVQNLDGLDFVDPTRGDVTDRYGRILDDRAAIYMRHGEPYSRVSVAGVVGTPLPGSEPASDGAARSDRDERGWESWLYWFAGQQRLFHFGPSPTFGDGPRTLYAEPPLNREYLRRLGAIDGVYNQIAHLLEAGGSRAYPDEWFRCHKLIQDEGVRGRRDMRVAVVEDSHTLIYPRQLDPILQAYAVGASRGDGGTILFVYAVPGDRLIPDSARSTAGRFVYSLELHLTAIDRRTRTTRRLDTLRTVATADSLGVGQHLYGTLELAIPAGDWDVRAAIAQPGVGAGSTAELPTTAFWHEAPPTMSDIVPGRPDLHVAWRGMGEPVPLNPLNAFVAGSSAELYYELYGLVRGRTYRTIVEFRRQDDERARPLRFTFSEPANEVDQRVRRTLGLGRTAPGTYLLRIEVHDTVTSRVVARERLVNVTDR